jgi:hypothetical protein
MAQMTVASFGPAFRPVGLFEGGGGGEGVGMVMAGVHTVVVVVEWRGGREAALTPVVVDVDHST